MNKSKENYGVTHDQFHVYDLHVFNLFNYNAGIIIIIYLFDIV